jgi:DNA gyrase subunit B
MSDYNESSIQILSGLEAVRRRPGMYIGGRDRRALHHMIDEVVDSFLEEAIVGECSRISVTLRPQAEVIIRADNLGWPIEIHTHEGVPLLQMILTLLGTPGWGRRFDISIAGGLHGIGVIAINALSEWMVVEVARDGFLWRIKCARGVVEEELRQIRPLMPHESTGTAINFKPDFTIFEPNDFDFDLLASRFKELACLLPGLTIKFRDERPSSPREEIYAEPCGLYALVEQVSAEYEPFEFPIFANIEFDMMYYSHQVSVSMQFAIQFVHRPAAIHLSYANTVATIDGGTDRKAFRQGLTNALNKYRPQNTAAFRAARLPSVVMATSILIPNPQFESQSKIRLMNREIVRPVSRAVKGEIVRFAAAHPDQMQRIIQHCIANRPARSS